MSFTENLLYSKVCEVYGEVDDYDGIIIGHAHVSFIKTYPNVRRKIIGVGALKFGEYAILTENGLEHKKL